MTRMVLSKKLCCGLIPLGRLSDLVKAVCSAVMPCSQADTGPPVQSHQGLSRALTGRGVTRTCSCISYRTLCPGDTVTRSREFISPLFFLGRSVYSCSRKNTVVKLQKGKKKKKRWNLEKNTEGEFSKFHQD